MSSGSRSAQAEANTDETSQRCEPFDSVPGHFAISRSPVQVWVPAPKRIKHLQRSRAVATVHSLRAKPLQLLGGSYLLAQLNTTSVVCVDGESRPRLVQLHLTSDWPSLTPIVGCLHTFRTMKTQGGSNVGDLMAFFGKPRPASRGDLLARFLADADRVRIRSGGTCHRHPEHETHLAEENDPRAVQSFLTQLSFDDTHSGFRCHCCGDPTIEFYSPRGLLAALGVHHGRSLRWEDGSWNGDSLLTSASARMCCEWLADHGVVGPKEERDIEAAASRAIAARFQAYTRIIEEPLLSAVKEAKSAEALASAFTSRLPNQSERARLCLRLYGVDTASWNVASGLDEAFAKYLLPAVSKGAILDAVTSAGTDEATVNGAARWLFGLKKWREHDRRDLLAVVLPLGRWGLIHPRAVNRRRTIEALAGIGGNDAVSLLRDVLEARLLPRSSAPDERADPSGMVTFMPGDSEYPNEFDDVVCAGIALARLGDAESLPRIAALAENSPAEAEAALTLALAPPPRESSIHESTGVDGATAETDASEVPSFLRKLWRWVTR